MESLKELRFFVTLRSSGGRLFSAPYSIFSVRPSESERFALRAAILVSNVPITAWPGWFSNVPREQGIVVNSRPSPRCMQNQGGRL